MNFLTGVDTTLINQYEPSLSSYYPSGSSDWTNQIGIAKRYIMNILRNNKRDTRKYLTPLWLYEDDTTAITETSYASTITSEEEFNRSIWVTEVNTTSGTAGFYLQGTNESSPTEDDWRYIPTRESVSGYTTTNSATTGTLSANLRTVVKLEQTFKYYRLTNTQLTACKFRSYLIEASFHYAHLFKTLEIIFNMLVASDENPRWSDKAEMYRNMFDMEMNNMQAYYDTDGSGAIDDNERNQQVNERRIYR